MKVLLVSYYSVAAPLFCVGGLEYEVLHCLGVDKPPHRPGEPQPMQQNEHDILKDEQSAEFDLNTRCAIMGALMPESCFAINRGGTVSVCQLFLRFSYSKMRSSAVYLSQKGL